MKNAGELLRMPRGPLIDGQGNLVTPTIKFKPSILDGFSFMDIFVGLDLQFEYFVRTHVQKEPRMDRNHDGVRQFDM